MRYLEENLHCRYRCYSVWNQEVPVEEVPSLKVIVLSAGYSLKPDEFADEGVRWECGAFSVPPSITSGKLGGVNHEDEFYKT